MMWFFKNKNNELLLTHSCQHNYTYTVTTTVCKNHPEETVYCYRCKEVPPEEIITQAKLLGAKVILNASYRYCLV